MRVKLEHESKQFAHSLSHFTFFVVQLLEHLRIDLAQSFELHDCILEWLVQLSVLAVVLLSGTATLCGPMPIVTHIETCIKLICRQYPI